MSTKTITFLLTEYEVPVWVSWVARNADGTILGFQYEPFTEQDGEYYAEYGQVCVIVSPRRKTVLQRV